MSSLNVELSDSAIAFLHEEVASGRSANHAESIERLVHAERRRRAQAHVTNLAIEALNTPSSPWAKGSSMDEIRSELRKQRNDPMPG